VVIFRGDSYSYSIRHIMTNISFVRREHVFFRRGCRFFRREVYFFRRER